MMYTLLVFLVFLVVGLVLRTAQTRDARRAWKPWAAASVLALVLACVTALTGCPLPPSDHCTPMATRCSPQGKPQRCSQSARWWSEPASQPCAALGVTCCLALSPYGNRVHACVPQSACLEEPDVIVLDAAEGGAQ